MKEKNLNRLAKQYSIELVVLFGSQSNGTANKESDFDIAYYSKKDLTLEQEGRLIVALMPFVRSENIDLVNMKTAPPLLLYAIFKHPKILYAKDIFFFYNMRAYAFKKYVEARPIFEEVSRRLDKKFGK